MEPVWFSTSDGVRLQGELRVDVPEPVASVVICHAHPRHGGSKDHPVLWAIRNELAGRRGYATLSFNFRGTMGSGGTYGGGRDEVRDAAAAFALMAERALPLLAVGWSFGASVALRAALVDERPSALALVGLPLRGGDLELPPVPEPALVRGRSILVAAGSEDPYCPPAELRAYAEAAAAHALVLEGTDHFLRRRERELASEIADWSDGVLGVGARLS